VSGQALPASGQATAARTLVFRHSNFTVGTPWLEERKPELVRISHGQASRTGTLAYPLAFLESQLGRSPHRREDATHKPDRQDYFSAEEAPWAFRS